MGVELAISGARCESRKTLTLSVTLNGINSLERY